MNNFLLQKSVLRSLGITKLAVEVKDIAMSGASVKTPLFHCILEVGCPGHSGHSGAVQPVS